jgi:glycerophosphoryl diester phosphodiesterase
MNIFEIPKTRFVSHRGFTPMAPENSLPSFYYAGLLGQWAIETDLRITKDGVIVCCHNDTLDHYCNREGAISQMTYDELCQFEIVNGNRANCFSKEERKIPLFSEYLAICRRFGSVPFIELKCNDVEYIVDSLRKEGFADDEVVMSSAEFSHLAETRRCSQDMFVHWIFAEEEKLPALSKIGNAGYSLAIADPFDCDESKVEDARRMGLKICLRAADNVTNLDRMKALGLDYFPTNTMHDKK